MISAKKLIKLAKKWQKIAAIRQKRITLSRTTSKLDTSGCSTLSTTEKGNFVLYSVDQRRFVLPLEYLRNEMVKGLLIMAEEEFGLPSDGRLVLLCDGAFVDYVIDLIKQRASKEIEKALLISVASSCCSSSYLHPRGTNWQLAVISF